MKLVAIYNLWDGIELLKGSINCIKDHVDLIIFIYQDVSNFEERYNPLDEILLAWEGCGVPYVSEKYHVAITGGTYNEKNKRNLGLEIAKRHGCTHFLHLDVDEYYQDFGLAKKQFIESGAGGSVCSIYTYFKKPSYRIKDIEGYYVPFIHKLNEHTMAGVSEYPFYCDPTRRINEVNIVEIPTIMHHYSYVRRDIERKVRNSSANVRINHSKILDDYYHPDLELNPEGYIVKHWGKPITVVDDIFGIGQMF